MSTDYQDWGQPRNEAPEDETCTYCGSDPCRCEIDGGAAWSDDALGYGQ